MLQEAGEPQKEQEGLEDSPSRGLCLSPLARFGTSCSIDDFVEGTPTILSQQRTGSAVPARDVHEVA